MLPLCLCDCVEASNTLCPVSRSSRTQLRRLLFLLPLREGVAGGVSLCQCLPTHIQMRSKEKRRVKGKEKCFSEPKPIFIFPKLSPTLASVPPPRSVNSRRSTTTTAYRFCDFMLLSLILRLRSSRVEFRILAFHIMKAHKQERWLSTEGSEVMRGFDNVSKGKLALSSFGLFLLTASMKSLPLKVALKGLNRN